MKVECKRQYTHREVTAFQKLSFPLRFYVPFLHLAPHFSIMSQIMPIMAFMGIAYCQRLGSHIRMDILIGKLKGRTLWIAELLGVTLMLILTVALIYGSFDHALRALTLGDTTDDMNIPTWPVKMLVPIMLTFLSIRLILHMWAYSAAIGEGGDEPVAVPLIEDAATQAMKEAESVSGMDDDDENIQAESANGSKLK